MKDPACEIRKAEADLDAPKLRSLRGRVAKHLLRCQPDLGARLRPGSCPELVERKSLADSGPRSWVFLRPCSSGVSRTALGWLSVEAP